MEDFRRQSFSSVVYNSSGSNMVYGGGFGFHGPHGFNHNYPSVHGSPFANPNNINHHRSVYTSLPVLRQPPLLPLPTKSATLPPSNKKITAGDYDTSMKPASSSLSAGKQSKNKRKKKNNQLQHQQQQTIKTTAPKDAENMKKTKKEDQEEEETGEEFLMGTMSTTRSLLSPPPSSLPLPRLLLMRGPRAKVVGGRSCMAEAVVVDVAVGAASKDLRKLLPL